MTFSAGQTRAIEVTEKVCSAVSLAASFFVITTFICSNHFQSPINRLLFYATIGNIMTNIGTVISTIGIQHGGDSALCQTQAFFIQWFMAADAYWSLCMACNVYLTLFRRYTTADLKKQEWKYLLFCYGTPFIPAFVFLFIKTESRGKMYGPAVLWCYIQKNWEVVRIAAFYGPVWLIIACTFAVYICTANVIFSNWRRIRRMSVGPQEIESWGEEYQSSSLETGECRPGTRENRDDSITAQNSQADQRTSPSGSLGPTAAPGVHDGPHEQETQRHPSFPSTLSPSLLTRQSHSGGQRRGSRRSSFERHSAAWAYSKYAMLYFISLFFTWVSISIHLAPPGSLAAASTNSLGLLMSTLKIPSTANRVYALASEPNDSFGLSFASAFVLPLQGFWNFLIYTATSPVGMKALFTTKPSKLSIVASFDNFRLKRPRPIFPLSKIQVNFRRLWKKDH